MLHIINTGWNKLETLSFASKYEINIFSTFDQQAGEQYQGH